VQVLLLFLLVQGTFRNKDLREYIAPLLGIKPYLLIPGRVTNDLRRNLHGLIERIPKTHCTKGRVGRSAIFYTRLYNRSLGTGLAVISPDACPSPDPSALRKLPPTHGMTKKILRSENLTHVRRKSFSLGF
jgi:hypothetical protein